MESISITVVEEDKKNYYQSYLEVLKGLGGGWVMVFNATFNNISVLTTQPKLG
jgi:hypothetical protein